MYEVIQVNMKYVDSHIKHVLRLLHSLTTKLSTNPWIWFCLSVLLVVPDVPDESFGESQESDHNRLLVTHLHYPRGKKPCVFDLNYKSIIIVTFAESN